VTRETVCEGARLDQEVVPAALACDDCGHAWEIDVPFFRCPRCASADVTGVTGVTGEELEVVSTDVEEVSACTA
jgi:Zn finger protein HypA/HybF involved in hydrogenase expression